MINWQRKFLSGERELAVSDPVFGMIYDEGGFWLGKPEACSLVGDPEVIIPADDNGPAPWQRSFYREVCARYPDLVTELWEAVARVVIMELPANARERFSALRDTDATNWCALTTLTLPEMPGGPWEASFYCRFADHNYSVTVLDWAVVDAENIGG